MTREGKGAGRRRTDFRPDKDMPCNTDSPEGTGNPKTLSPPRFTAPRHCWHWIEIFIVTLMMCSWSVAANTDFQNHGICQRKYIRNNVDDLNRLKGCKVIEGSLQISLIDAGKPEHYQNLSFPELREITGYLLLFQAKGLTTLGDLFPNLAVIRGQELLHSYALVITDMDEMQEIGLQSLTNIERGSVWIEGNPNLCYVDTIDWVRIVNDSSDSTLYRNIYANKPGEQCPDTCPDNCPVSDADDRNRLCWTNTKCQRVDAKTCKNNNCDGPCMENGECCSSECLGGCTGTGPHECFVCKHVHYKQKCQENCPGGFYEYLNRRCLTRDECLAVNVGGGGSKISTGKLYEDKFGKRFCVLECPKETELSANTADCIPCDGACKKNCTGAVVETIEGAKKLAGCTRIIGALMIKIRGSAAGKLRLFKELKENLDKIEEIDHYLIVTYTYSIYSLDFLENLKRIRGLVLDEGRYALVVKSNENLVELWNSTMNPNRTITIDNKDARVLFHYNPKLCPNKIWEFVNQAGIVRPKDDKINIGITNGDKVPCNTRRLAVEVCRKSNSSVTIKWENFRRNLTQTNHLLNYEVSYKEALEYPKKNVSIYDNRDPCGEDDWKVLDIAKMQDKDVQGQSQHQEPEWEYERIINGLKHFTWYALYVKTIVIPDETSPNNNTGAQSALIYFQTLPDTPSKPQGLIAKAKGPDTLAISWEAPLTPNGILASFKIYIKELPVNQSFLDERDVCTSGRAPKKDSFLAHEAYDSTSDKTTMAQSDKDCCSCSASGTPTKSGRKLGQDPNQVKLKEDVYNTIMDDVFVANPNFTPLDNKTESNDINKSGGRKRKRRDTNVTAEDTNDAVPDSTEKVFPGEFNEQTHKQQAVIDGKLIATINYTLSQKNYQFELKNLTHFTFYSIEIQACRHPADSKDIENDTRTCSEIVKEKVQTHASPTADDIDIKSISTNVTGNQLHLRWMEPKQPNGVVMGYKIFVLKVSGSSGSYGEYRACITRKKFQDNGRNFTFPDSLQPGNYSVKIQVMSLAMDSNVTDVKYFFVEDNQPKDYWFYLLVILLPLMLLICIMGLVTVYYFRNKGWTIGPVVISHNPEYMENVDIPDEWEVSRDQIELIKELGNGSFGMVFEGILRDFIPGSARLHCAVKTVADEANSEDRALFLKEAELMTKLNCHHLVKLLGVVSKTQPTYVVMELMTYGDLKKYLRARRPDSPYNEGEPPPTLRQILRIACEIADGMAYIHSHKLVHRDLAARNCMVAEDKSVKVGDFGMTKEVVQTDYYRKQTRGLLPVRWMAPESLRDGVFTNQTDVWSFGVVLWEMATLAAQPYQGLSNSQVLTYVQGGGVMERPDNCPDVLFSLMLSCWEYVPRHRPNFTDILDNVTQDLDASFAAVSFFHSREGQEFKYQCKNRPLNDEPITVRTPLRATMEEIDSDLDDYDSDDEHNLRDMVNDISSSIPRRLPTSPTMTTTGSMPTNTTTSMTNGLILLPLSCDSGQIINNNRPGGSPPSTLPTSQSLTMNPQIIADGGAPLMKPYSNSNNNYASTNPGGGGDSGFVCLNLSPNQTSSAYTPNGLETVNAPIAKYTNIPSSQSSGQINSGNRRVNNSGSSNSNSATTPNSAPPGSNESSKALSLAYSSSDGSKISNGGTSVNLGGVTGSAGPGSGGNGYITLRHSPVTETYQKNNRTSQF